MNWTFIISTIGCSTALFAAIAWLARSVITHWLTKGVEQYKARLKFEHAAALESLKSEMQIIAREREVRFLHLHEKRAEIIAALYEHIVETHDAAEACLDAFKENGARTRFDLAKVAIDRGDELAEFVIRHKIYFSVVLANELEELYGCLIDVGLYYKMHCVALREGNKEEQFIGMLGEVQIDMEGALKSTEMEFRSLLGVEQERRE